MGELTKLPNIGSALENQLNEIGVESYDDLVTMGAEEAWLKIRSFDKSAWINRLYALEGAIYGVKKNLLPISRKEELKKFTVLVRSGKI